MKIFPRGFKGWLKALARIVLVSYALIVVGLFFFQEKLLFVPIQGERINSLVFHVPKSKGLILFFHGNAGSLRGWGYVAQNLARKCGYDVWICDFPGFGKSTGAIFSET